MDNLPEREELEKMVSTYLRSGLNMDMNDLQWRPLPRTPVTRRNPELEALVRNYQDEGNAESLDGIHDLYDAHGEEVFYETLDIALAIENSREAGMLMGFLSPETDIEQDRIGDASDAFIQGLEDGQIYALKVQKGGMDFFLAGLGCLGASAIYNRINPAGLTPEAYELFSNLKPVTNSLAWLSASYGMYAMLKNHLLGNDPNISRDLVTTGQFSLHRNPFYTSMAMAYTSFIAPVIAGHLASGNVLPTIPLLLACTLVGIGMHKAVLKDETVLERSFGEEYEAYKQNTPRYLPAVRKLFT